MSLYNKPSAELLYDLINRDNPGLIAPLSSENVILLSGPTAINLGTFGRNTKATFNAIAGKGFSGRIEVMYDRINLANLYSGQAPVVRIPYLARTRRAILDNIRETLGIYLEPEMVSAIDTVFGASTTATGTLTIPVLATHLTYQSYFTITYVREKPALADVYLPENDYKLQALSNFAFSGRIFNRSWHYYQSVLNAAPRGVVFRSSDARFAAVLNMLINGTGLQFKLSTALPAINVDELDITDAIISYASTAATPNSNPRYKNVFILTPTPGRHRWTQPLYFHVNPRFTEANVLGEEDLRLYIAGQKLLKLSGDNAIRGNEAKTVAVYPKDYADYGYMRGSPHSGFFWNGSFASRIAQHSVVNKAAFDYAVDNDLPIVLELGGLVRTGSFLSVDRNGYKSEASTAELTNACSVVKCIYFDPASKSVKTSMPNNGSYGGNWTP